MAQVGMLGDILFEVSDDRVETIENVAWSGSARYSTHQRHLTHAQTEFTGIDPDKIQFDMTLSAYLGVNPMTTLNKLWEYERKGTTLPLVIGQKVYGKYRWTLLSHTIRMKYFDGAGDMTHCSVSVSLQEYL